MSVSMVQFFSCPYPLQNFKESNSYSNKIIWDSTELILDSQFRLYCQRSLGASLVSELDFWLNHRPHIYLYIFKWPGNSGFSSVKYKFEIILKYMCKRKHMHFLKWKILYNIISHNCPVLELPPFSFFFFFCWQKWFTYFTMLKEDDFCRWHLKADHTKTFLK